MNKKNWTSCISIRFILFFIHWQKERTPCILFFAMAMYYFISKNETLYVMLFAAFLVAKLSLRPAVQSREFLSCGPMDLLEHRYSRCHLCQLRSSRSQRMIFQSVFLIRFYLVWWQGILFQRFMKSIFIRVIKVLEYKRSVSSKCATKNLIFN